jgi:hypothetical protein
MRVARVRREERGPKKGSPGFTLRIQAWGIEQRRCPKMVHRKFGHYAGEEKGTTLRMAKAAAGLPRGVCVEVF